jgi:hypothetical protein
MPIGIEHVSSATSRAFSAHKPDVRNALALGCPSKIPAPIAQFLLQVGDVLRNRFDAARHTIETFQPRRQILHNSQKDVINAGTGQIEGNLSGWRLRLVERHRRPSVFVVPLGDWTVLRD